VGKKHTMRAKNDAGKTTNDAGEMADSDTDETVVSDESKEQVL